MNKLIASQTPTSVLKPETQTPIQICLASRKNRQMAECLDMDSRRRFVSASKCKNVVHLICLKNELAVLGKGRL